MTLVRQQGKSYIYQVRIIVTDGQEPNFHESTPFILKVYDKEVTCEALDFDYGTGVLFFTTNRYLNSATYCKVLLDSSFILEELRHRLVDIKNNGVNEDLPFAKFLFEETDQISKVSHKTAPLSF